MLSERACVLPDSLARWGLPLPSAVTERDANLFKGNVRATGEYSLQLALTSLASSRIIWPSVLLIYCTPPCPSLLYLFHFVSLQLNALLTYLVTSHVQYL